jgi:hypothetical protein
VHGFDDVEVSDDDVVAPALLPRALTAGELVFPTVRPRFFKPTAGPCTSTTVVHPGRVVDDDGHFASIWPPSYRASYDLRWMVEDGAIVGLRFRA